LCGPTRNEGLGTGLISEIISSAIGAIVLLLVVRLVRGRM